MIFFVISNISYFLMTNSQFCVALFNLSNVIEIPAAGNPDDVSKTWEEIGSGCLAIIF